MGYDYFRQRRQARRQKFIELLGGKCQTCGATSNLHFDHIDPKNKARPTGNIWDSNEADILLEINKCQLLCQPCHHAKTLAKNEYGAESKHGTLWRYKKHKCRCPKCRRAMSLYYFEKLKDK